MRTLDFNSQSGLGSNVEDEDADTFAQSLSVAATLALARAPSAEYQSPPINRFD